MTLMRYDTNENTLNYENFANAIVLQAVRNSKCQKKGVYIL